MPEEAHPACLVAWHAWTGDNHAGLDDALKIPLCHSREGGNPFGTTNCTGAMDSRLRGNDRLRIVSATSTIVRL